MIDDGRDGSGKAGGRGGRSEIRERSLSIRRTVVPRSVDDRPSIRFRILVPALTTGLGGVEGFVAGVATCASSAGADEDSGRRRTFCTLVASRVDQRFAVVE